MYSSSNFSLPPVAQFQGSHSQIQTLGDSDLENPRCLEISFSVNFPP